jgi:hypothetical protein
MRRMVEVTLFRDGRGWGVTLALPAGELRRYRYASEAQARFFAAVLALGPQVLPPGGEVVLASRPRRRGGQGRTRVSNAAG